MTFFSDQIFTEGSKSTLEKFIFAPEANYVEDKSDEDQPKMLDRFLSGLLHPMIHAGHAVEFNAPGMLAEGLALACVTESRSGALVPRDLFFPTETPALESLKSAFSSLSTKPTDAPHLFSILARMARDPALAPTSLFAETIWKYAAEWSFDTKDEKVMEAKFEELAWVVSFIYGVCGLQPGKEFRANFFTMHLVTSSIFIPSFMAYLTPSSRATLIKTYLAAVLSGWVARGRPSISLTNFYSNTSAAPSPPGLSPTPHPDTLDKSNLNPNPWFPLLQTTLTHPNEHLPKIQRTFAYFAAKYGTRKAGYFTKDLGLKGVELLDGTLFLRVAGLTAKRLGWIREGEEKGDWDILSA